MAFHLLVLSLLCWQLGHATNGPPSSLQSNGAMLASFEQVKAGCVGLHSVALWSALGSPDGKAVYELQRACYWVERLQAEADTGSDFLLQDESRYLAEDDDEAKIVRDDVPWFANSKESHYPVLSIFIFVVASFLVTIFWEGCWLRSTVFSAGLWYRHKAVAILKQPDNIEVSVGQSGRRLSSFDVTAYWNNVQKVFSYVEPKFEGHEHTCFVRFTKRAYKGYVEDGQVTVEVERIGPCSEEVKVQVKTQDRDTNDIAAKAGDNYEYVDKELAFLPGQKVAAFQIPLLETYCWESTRWFRVELVAVTAGDAKIYPQNVRVFVIDKSLYPGKLPESWSDSSYGMRRLSLGYHFMKECVAIRGKKFRKTLLAMMYPPVHNVVVTSLVQKFIITFVSKKEFIGDTYNAAIREIVVLAIVQFASTCILRWSDHVQVGNRGRTGGIRQTHRLHLLDKMLILGHHEHMHYKGVDWLYAAVHDTNNIVVDVYWQFFVIIQGVESLILTFLLLILWDLISVVKKGGTYQISKLAPSITFIVILPVTTFLIWRRRRAVFDHIQHRAENEASWMNIFSWLAEIVHYIYGMGYRELASVEATFKGANKSFLKEHQQARDTMNDSIAISMYMGAIGYIIILVWGGFGLLNDNDNNDQPSMMEAGHYVLLLKLFSNFGKYMSKVQGSLVKFQRGCVSLERLTKLLNQNDGGRGLVKQTTTSEGQCLKDIEDTKEDDCIRLRSVCLDIRNKRFGIGPFCGVFTKSGSEILFPFGKMVHLRSHFQARVLSIMAMAAGVVEPTSGTSHCPDYVWRKMLPQQAVASFGDLTCGHELEKAGATPEQATRLLSAFEMDPEQGARHLSPGDNQVLALLRALLRDPEVLVIWKPCAFMAEHMQKNMWMLIRVWQKCGGADAILRIGESGDPSSSDGIGVSKNGKRRTVILSSCHDFECDPNQPEDVVIDLDAFWAEEETVIPATQTEGKAPQEDPGCQRVDGEALPEAR